METSNVANKDPISGSFASLDNEEIKAQFAAQMLSVPQSQLTNRYSPVSKVSLDAKADSVLLKEFFPPNKRFRAEENDENDVQVVSDSDLQIEGLMRALSQVQLNVANSSLGPNVKSTVVKLMKQAQAAIKSGDSKVRNEHMDLENRPRVSLNLR